MQFILERASSFAADIDFVIGLIFVITLVWFVVAQFVFFGFLFRYRRSRNPKAGYVEGVSHEETKWVHWAHYAVIVCDLVIIFFAVQVWYHVKQKLPPAEETIRITGQQWAWTFQHPGPDKQLDTADDITLVDELHVRSGTTYHFLLDSKDVIHSFSVPVFRLKQDAIPGRVITGWFQPTRPGRYDIQCAEICGIGHGVMEGKIHVETAEQHAAWLAAAGQQRLAGQ